MARILIAGCGYVGTAVAERLVAGGHEVWGLRRN
ncbi:MAG TPA: SDR family NAD(P)-dependent oxidoreductase, partial [Candidatus Methylomirabilis sp.]|nr:SDR family NAD(P)-dependent oxidoreductase [Candidatus Methylomirabilis sp.]